MARVWKTRTRKGRAGSSPASSAKENSLDTDIFCFQEVSPQLFSELGRILPQHGGAYATENKIEFLGFTDGRAIFSGCDFQILSSREINLGCQTVNDAGYLQFARIKAQGKTFFLGNVHGQARPGKKLDTPARLKQSRLILDFFADKNSPTIIGGDFNLLPETRSIGVFEKAGHKNLIKDYGIKCTRNELSWKNLKKGEEKQCFADYVFTSPDIKVNSFEVPDIEVSDHLPLILDFEV